MGYLKVFDSATFCGLNCCFSGQQKFWVFFDSVCVRVKKEKEIDEDEEEAFMVNEFYKVKRVFHSLGGEL